MKKLKDILIISDIEDITVQDIREHLIKIMVIVFNVLTFPLIIIGVIEAIELNQPHAWISYIVFYLPILIALIFRNKISYTFIVILFLTSAYFIGTVNIILYGFSGAGLPVFFTIIVLATIFEGIRSGLFAIIATAIPMIIVGYLMVNNILEVDVDLMEISTKTISWITAISTLVILSSAMIFGYGYIQINLINSHRLLKRQKKDLIKANKKQKEDLELIKQTQIELKRAKEEAEQSNQLKTQFINNMSHEIRTPLNGIMGFSGLLCNDTYSPKKQKHYLEIIQNSGKQLLRIIDDILEISTLETKQVKVINEEINLNDFLMELFSVFDMRAKESNTPLYLKKGLINNSSVIITDGLKLHKILSNLIENAIKYTNKGYIEFGYNIIQNERTIEFYVKDTGVGISPEKHETIFERFRQADLELSKNVGGLGLGLSIAKENAELLGGKIKLESELNVGTTFYVQIPFLRATPEPTKKQDKEDLKVLIVEDEEVNFLYLEALFEDEFDINPVIFHAKNGKEAVKYVQDNDFSFILMDLKLPIMSGFEATKIIKEQKPNIPIIAQTAYKSEKDRKKAFAAGVDYFLTKPINTIELQNIIDKILL